MSHLPSFYVLLLVSAVYQDVSGLVRLLRRGKYGRLEPPPIPNDTPIPPDQWFTQLLDHFDPTNNITWHQRYQLVSDYYVLGGPVFILLGGEGAASPAWLVNGNIVNYAKKNNAFMFQLEHRFYGESHPTSDLSVDNLRYLTTEQALADIAYFVQSMSANHSFPAGTRWIAFGGSYAGNLAAWVKYKYSHPIHGAVSSSGPVLAQTDFSEYMDVVSKSLSTYGENCTKAVQSANNLIIQYLKHRKGQEVINKKFRLCDPIDVSNQNDVYNLLESLADNIAGIVQYNKVNPSFTWDITIDTICDIMVDKSIGNPLLRYAAVNSVMIGEQGCCEYKYDSMIAVLQNTSWEGYGGAYGARQWFYQTCTEFGYYQTSENKEALFGNNFPLDFFIQQCTDVYGERFTKKTVDDGVYRTNTFYGGLDNPATRVVYVHGSIDPWHALGITSTRIPESPAIFINGTAHCANMYPPSDEDPPALQAARQEVGHLIETWID